MIFSFIDLNIILGKKWFNPNLFMQKFRLLLKMLAYLKNVKKNQLCNSLTKIMSKMISELSLIDNKSLSEINLKQPEFTYSTCGQFAKRIT